MTQDVIELIVILIAIMVGMLAGAWVRDGYYKGQLVNALNRMKGEQTMVVDAAVRNFMVEAQALIQRSALRMSAAQAAQVQGQQPSFVEAKDDVDTISLFLRDHYAREISLGWHANRKLGQIVTGYLAREREVANMQLSGDSKR